MWPDRLASRRAESAARDRLRSSWLGYEQEVGVLLPDPAGPEWCLSECAAPCSIGETPPDIGSGVVEVVDWAMSGIGPGLKLVNL